jgi:hemoglobin
MDDIKNKDDIALLINTFYATATKDPLLKPTFDRFIDSHSWDTHVLKIIDFWSMVIFKNNDYSGNVFAPHIPMQLTKVQIDNWVQLFSSTVDLLYSGPNADEAKSKAEMMGIMFTSKINKSTFINIT